MRWIVSSHSVMNCQMFVVFVFLLTLDPTFGRPRDSSDVLDLFIEPTTTDDFYYGTVPDDFIWGAASASYQIEGAWDRDGKGVNIWDTFTHQSPSPITNNDTGDVACESYRKYKEDVQLLTNLGVSHYRFSISWARVLPKGTVDEVNDLGVQYYNNLIDELLANGIQPMVTLYHWDLPQYIQDTYNGLQSEDFIELFGEYARFCYKTFGDRVKLWITFNEPHTFITYGFESGRHAPGVSDPGVAVYQVAHIVLKAHARAWHIYDDEFRSEQNGKVGITLSVQWYAGSSTQLADLEAAYRSVAFQLDWFAHPIFSASGDYPEVMKKRIAERSAGQGLTESRLPTFDDYWINYIRGTHDFFGVNHYTTFLATNQDYDADVISFNSDIGSAASVDSSWYGYSWINVVPWGFRNILNYIRITYDNPNVIITESGYGDDGSLEDDGRVDYLEQYIDAVLQARNLDGCNIEGYTVWSVMDNFEWVQGYTKHFGLYNVDFDDPERPRTAKSSVAFYSEVVANKGFPDEE